MMYAAMLNLRTSLLGVAGILMLATLPAFVSFPAHADEASKGADSAQIMREFNQQRIDTERAKSITEKDKHRVMFLLGIVLIVLILATGGLGVAMVVYGKKVFIPHMIFAGLSITLALVHAIVGIVWFYPF